MDYFLSATTGSILEAIIAGDIPAIIPIKMAIEIPNAKIEALKKSVKEVRYETTNPTVITKIIPIIAPMMHKKTGFKKKLG